MLFRPNTPLALPERTIDATKPAAARHYTLSYVAALFFMGLLAIYSFGEMRHHIRTGIQITGYVDDALYQYATANRIAGAATLAAYATDNKAYHDANHALIESSYKELVSELESIESTISKLSAPTHHAIAFSLFDLVAEKFKKQEDTRELTARNLNSIYYEAPYNLDAKFREIISLIEAFMQAPEGESQKKLAAEIDAIIRTHISDGTRLASLALQDMATHEFEIAALILAIYTVTTVITLLLLGGFLFRPLFQRVVETDATLRQHINNQSSILERVERAETRLRTALEGMQDGLWDWDLKSNEVYYSDRWLDMLGYTREEIPGTLESWQKLVHPADIDRAYDALSQHFANPNTPYQITLRYRHKDGSLRHILARGKALRTSTGEPYRMLGGHTDVTALTEAQDNLKEQKSLLELFTHNTPLAVAMLDRQMNFLNASTRWANDYQLNTSDIIGKSFFSVHAYFPIRWVGALREALSGVPSEAAEDSFEIPATSTQPAQTVSIRWRIQPWRDSHGFIGGAIVFSEIITEQVMLRRDITRANSLNQALAEFVSTELLYSGTAIEPSIEEICHFAAKSLRTTRVGVWRLDDEGENAACLRLYDVDKGMFEQGDTLQRGDSFAFFGRLSINKPAIISDASSDEVVSPALQERFSRLGIQAAICAPVRVEQKIWGFLSLTYNTPRQWQNYEITFAQRLADVIAISVTAHQRQQLNESLQKAREAAETATQAKGRFVANMSHEVRTPLNGIIGITDILSRTELNPKQAELMATLQGSCQHLLSLVSDILDFSKLEAGGVKLENIPFSISQLLRELASMMVPKIESSPLEFIIKCPPHIPDIFLGDPTRIRQILINLLSNAAKFTSAGHIMLSVNYNDAETGQKALEFSVADSGIGIPADKINSLFEKFTQADTSTTRKYGGTGLGLSITKELAELMGGSVVVSSAEGHGSTFSVTLPLQPKAPYANPAPHSALRGQRLLIYCKNNILGQSLRDHIAALAARCDLAENFDKIADHASAAALEKQPYDIALIEIPSDDAAAALQQLRKQEPLARTSLVALCASNEASEELLLMHGAVACIKKPILPATLMAQLGGVAEARRTGNMATLFSSQNKVTEHRANAAGQLQGMQVLLAEDNETNQIIVDHYLKEFGCLVTWVKNGAEAVAAFAKNPGFSVILMDCQMPEMDGFAATAAIRAQSTKGARVPIIALTANAYEGDKDACLKAGMSDYLAKPVKADALKEKLKDASKACSISSAPVSGATSESNLLTSIININELYLNFGKDPQLVSRVLRSFLETAQSLMQAAETQLGVADYEALAKTAHTLKGASLNIYAAPLSEKATQLERAAKQADGISCSNILKQLNEDMTHIGHMPDAD